MEKKLCVNHLVMRILHVGASPALHDEGLRRRTSGPRLRAGRPRSQERYRPSTFITIHPLVSVAGMKVEFVRLDHSCVHEFKTNRFHPTYPMSICPVTAAAMRAARRSLMIAMALSAVD